MLPFARVGFRIRRNIFNSRKNLKILVIKGFDQFSILTIISLFSLLLVDFLDGSELLLEFHSPVLEPDLDLSLSQTQGVSNLNATSPSQVVVEVELFLQLQHLLLRVNHPVTYQVSRGTSPSSTGVSRVLKTPVEGEN